MKIFKYIYYFLLCHLFPNRITKGALGESFIMSFVREGDCWYADIKHWPGLKWQLEMVGGADDLLDFLETTSRIPNRVTIAVNPTGKRLGFLVKEHENNKGATYRDSLTGRKVWLCNVSKWAFGKHPDTITYSAMQSNCIPPQNPQGNN